MLENSEYIIANLITSYISQQNANKIEMDNLFMSASQWKLHKTTS